MLDATVVVLVVEVLVVESVVEAESVVVLDGSTLLVVRSEVVLEEPVVLEVEEIELVASEDAEVLETDDDKVDVRVLVLEVVVTLVGMGVFGVTGSSSPGISSDVPFPITLEVKLVVVLKVDLVVLRLPPTPPSVYESPVEVLAKGSVKLVKDVRRLVVVGGRAPPIPSAVV